MTADLLDLDGLPPSIAQTQAFDIAWQTYRGIQTANANLLALLSTCATSGLS